MKILMFSPNDPASMAIAFTKAINRYTNHLCRSITTTEKYSCEFEKDLHIPDVTDFDEIEQLLKESDIYHFHTIFTEDVPLGPLKITDYIKGKKVVSHFHGHPKIRKSPTEYRIKCREQNRKVLVSTPDLKLFFPESTWLPNIVDIYSDILMPSDEKHEEFTVSQAITNYALKDTEILIMAAKKAGVQLDLIMNVSHRNSLERKRKSQLCFDHLCGFYGLSSLESFSQGVPVIANLSDWVQVNIKEFAETEDLPWLNCKNAEEVENEIHWLKGSYLEEGKRGRNFMESHWNPEKVVSRLIKFYETL